MGFKSFESADRIIVKRYSKTTLKTIADRALIAQVAQFTEAHGEGWSTPIAGTPIGSITLEFYSGDRFLGDLGIGKNFLDAQGCGGFFSRQLATGDRRTISRLIEISDDLIE